MSYLIMGLILIAPIAVPLLAHAYVRRQARHRKTELGINWFRNQ